MRILQISSARSFGGGEKHLVDLSSGLARRGHDVFAAVRPNAEWKDKLSFLPPPNIAELPLRNSLDVLSARKLVRIIRENDIGIVHAHLARDYAAAGLAARFASQAKFVLTRHVLFPMNPLHKFFLSNVSKAVAVSGAVEMQLKKIVAPAKIVKIHNGIDIAHFADANRDDLRREFRFEHNIPFDAPLVGTIGELKVLKGQRDFVLAAQIVARQFPDARFAIIGRDNSLKKDFRRELKRLVKVFGLENRFLWLDWVEETQAALGAFDIFVSASHSESFGLAILEAMASGVGVVATASEGAKELLPAENLVPLENPARLAEAICFLLENEEKRIEFGARIQTRARENFGLEKMVAETEKMYLGL